MTTVREARIEAAARAIDQQIQIARGWQEQVVPVEKIAEAVVDALFTADKLIDNVVISREWGLTDEDLDRVNGGTRC